MTRTEFLLFDIDYAMEEGRPVIRLWGRTASGQKVLARDREFYPYFYLEVDPHSTQATELEHLKARIKRLEEMGEGFRKIEVVERKLLGKPSGFLKITMQDPRDIPKLADTVKEWSGVKKPYEADVPLYRRYLIDRGIQPMSFVSAEGTEEKGDGWADISLVVSEIKPSHQKGLKLSTIAMDIEVSGDRIIMVSLVSPGFSRVLTYGWKERPKKKYVEVLSGEKEMLERLLEILRERDPDVIATYNGDIYDFPKIRERLDSHKTDFLLGRDRTKVDFVKRARTYCVKPAGMVNIDLYPYVDNILGGSLSSETFTLDNVSRELLGEGKRPIEWKRIEGMWNQKKGLDRVADYCRRDSELTLKLADRLLPQMAEICRLTGQAPFDVSRMTFSQLVEWLLMKRAFGDNEMILNRPAYDEIKRREEAEPYSGGYVHQPEPGIHDSIALFDFASLYPSAIIAHNISPETLSTPDAEGVEKVPEGEHYFLKSPRGFIPRVMEEVVRKRREIKKEMEGLERGSQRYKDLDNRQYSLKIIANASYGYYAYPGSRWYSRVCAKSIAAWGRFYIQKLIAFAQEKGYMVVYGDTDSLFLADCSHRKAMEFRSLVRDMLPEAMDLEFQGVFRSGIFVPAKTGMAAKKRYALIDEAGNITIRGFESVRRDWSNLAKETQEKVLGAILRDRDREKALSLMREAISLVSSGKAKKKDLVIYTQITRPLDDYDQIGPHVAAAKKLAARGRTVIPGSVIGYIITKGTGTISSRAEPEEFAGEYDPDYYINNQIIPASLRILHALGVSEDDIIEEAPNGQKSLDAFMKKKGLKEKFAKGWVKFKNK